ncbi:hypothetical protein FBBNIHIM_01375 [Pseudocitrobacter vendiensis]|uniref:Uncharacterized protein n=1 Tax=Pseudocitrobacter vendiensis TaxID=2488306 RepID=A0ABM9F3Z0_9ENTR|nr:hypothetical protein FBBNIHIM_01375 [Pseudocitrobacter vendiensis]
MVRCHLAIAEIVLHAFSLLLQNNKLKSWHDFFIARTFSQGIAPWI